MDRAEDFELLLYNRHKRHNKKKEYLRQAGAELGQAQFQLS